GFGMMIRRAHAGQSQREPIWLRSAQMRCPQCPQMNLKIMDIHIAGAVLGKERWPLAVEHSTHFPIKRPVTARGHRSLPSLLVSNSKTDDLPRDFTAVE